jgi:hypothetical protein
MAISSDTISIRLATPDDAPALARLAALDSSEAPVGPVLLAEREGELQAALPIATAHSVPLADPFVATGELVALLRLRAARLEPRLGLAGRVRDAVASRRRHPPVAA